MSAWLQQQALAPAVLRLQAQARRRRQRNGSGNAAGVCVEPTAAVRARVSPGAARGHGDAWMADQLALLALQVTALRRDLRRIGVLVLVAALLLALPYGWPALRWLLLPA
jgi:hypothetical protein